jgi:hypothetical protein
MHLFTPYADEWKMETSHVEIAAKLFAQDYGKQENRGAQSKLLLFLYAKRILAEKKSIIRKLKYKDLLAAGTAESQIALE